MHYLYILGAGRRLRLARDKDGNVICSEDESVIDSLAKGESAANTDRVYTVDRRGDLDDTVDGKKFVSDPLYSGAAYDASAARY